MLRWLGTSFMAVLNLFLPIYQQARSSQVLGRGIRIFLHILIVVAFAGGLWYLGVRTHIEAKLNIKNPLFQHLGPLFFTILFLLVYAMCWLSYFLWLLFFAETDVGAFPDIDQAWAEACAALRAARLTLQDLPVFLVLGTPEDEERALFQAAQARMEVTQAPAGPNDPLHLYATRDAIYITCAGASALGCFSRSLVGKTPGRPDKGPELEMGGNDDEDEVMRTLSPSSSKALSANRAVEKMAGVLVRAEREGRPLTKAEKRELRAIYRQDNPQRSPMNNTELIDLQVARLEYLCRLIVRDRAPFCSVNGILVLVPFAGCDSDKDASDTGLACQRDLAVALPALRVHCPLYALVCDLETAPGFTDFIQQFNAGERLRRIGQRCHLMPELGRPATASRTGPTEAPAARLMRSLADWMCDAVVKSFVASKFQMEPAPAEIGAAIESNSRLFLFYDEMQQRSKRLGHILARAVTSGRDPERLLFGGCYVAGTGTNPDREQAFVKGVLDRLVESQNCVYWTDTAFQEEATYRRWAEIGWTVLFLLMLAIVGAAGWLWFKNMPSRTEGPARQNSSLSDRA